MEDSSLFGRLDLFFCATLLGTLPEIKQSTISGNAPDPDEIHNEMLKHLPPEGLDSLLALHNKIWQQGNSPENG